MLLFSIIIFNVIICVFIIIIICVLSIMIIIRFSDIISLPKLVLQLVVQAVDKYMNASLLTLHKQSEFLESYLLLPMSLDIELQLSSDNLSGLPSKSSEFLVESLLDAYFRTVEYITSIVCILFIFHYSFIQHSNQTI